MADAIMPQERNGAHGHLRDAAVLPLAPRAEVASGGETRLQWSRREAAIPRSLKKRRGAGGRWPGS
ncbi:hypothetical protein HMPREF9057_00179 [Actinomyces sp. oral taxon 171 str. F0337]|nr:hypothetical protein HMPREF9057_00179 [Actinomyces sp. oral taxon 171 str. F0337]